MKPRGIRLPQEVWDLIDEEASRRGQNPSEVIRAALMAEFFVSGAVKNLSATATKIGAHS